MYISWWSGNLNPTFGYEQAKGQKTINRGFGLMQFVDGNSRKMCA
jgi:hypothetical protein